MFTIFIAANFLPSPPVTEAGCATASPAGHRGVALRRSRLTYQTVFWLARCIHCHSTLKSVFISLIPVDYLQAANEPFLFTVIEFFEEHSLIPLNFLIFANTGALILSPRHALQMLLSFCSRGSLSSSGEQTQIIIILS